MTKFKNRIGALVLAATAVTGFTATPAMAGGRYDDGYSRYERNDRYERGDRYDRREYRRGDRYYQNNRNNYQRCKNSGTGGTIIGAVAGGLLGNEVARRGSKTEGSIIGAAVGALAGRAIDKSDSNCNRRYR